MVGVVAAILASWQKIKLLLCRKQQGFKSQTSLDEGGVNAPSIGIKHVTSGQPAVALAN